MCAPASHGPPPVEAPLVEAPPVEAPKRAKPKPPTSGPPEPSDVPAWLARLGVPALDDPRWGRQVARWLDHHRAKGSRFVDWSAAWRTWRSRAEEYDRPGLPGLQSATTGRFRRSTVQNPEAAYRPSPWDVPEPPPRDPDDDAPLTDEEIAAFAKKYAHIEERLKLTGTT